MWATADIRKTHQISAKLFGWIYSPAVKSSYASLKIKPVELIISRAMYDLVNQQGQTGHKAGLAGHELIK